MSIIISIIALIISIINLILNFIRYWKQIEIVINTCRISKINNKYFYICNIQIINFSKIPISIKGISCNESNVPSKPYLVAEYTKRQGKEVIKSEEVKTFDFPINLDNLQGKSGYIEFESKDKIDMKDIKFVLYTNRGTINNAKINCENIKDDANYRPFN